MGNDDNGVETAVSLIIKLTGIGHSVSLDGNKVVHVVAVQSGRITACLVDDSNLLGVATLVVEISQPNGNGHNQDKQQGHSQCHKYE